MPTRFWYLLSRKLADEATLEEIRELESMLLKDSDLASIAEVYTAFFKKKQKREMSTEQLMQAWDYQIANMDNSFGQNQKEQKKAFGYNFFSRKNFLLVTAALIVTIFGVGWLFFSGNQFENKTGILSDSNNIIITADDEVKKTLPDGSEVWLNKGSRVSYNSQFGETNRDITLVGEAFFDVVHKAELPMVVHTETIDIRVKGTAFNIKAYADDNKVEAALIRGSIEVLNPRNKNDKFLMKPNEKLVIAVNSKKNRKVAIAKAPDSKLFKLDTLKIEERSGLIPEISWIQGKLVFNNESFEQLADKLGRWYNVEFILSDASLAGEKFTGVFENESLQEALLALQFTFAFNYSIDDKKVIITKK